MNRTNNLKRTSPRFYSRNLNIPLIVLATLFITGLVVGAICVHTAGSGVLEKLTRMFQNYSQIRSQQSMLMNFGNSFATGAFCIILLYLSGLSAWGIVPALLLPLFKGMGLGMICGTLYADYGIRGFGYCVMVILPGALLSALAVILSAKEAIRASSFIFARFCLSREAEQTSFRNYTVKFFILLLFIGFGAVMDMLTIQFFSGLFIIW